jgi:hypothetical protein
MAASKGLVGFGDDALLNSEGDPSRTELGPTNGKSMADAAWMVTRSAAR